MGLIHIYCGDGKGKTTAALGLALRAAGSGMKVHIVQLLKGSHSSELVALDEVSGITVSYPERDFGFVFAMSDDERKALTECHNRLLLKAYELICSGSADMLILDEFNAAYELNVLDRALAERIVFEKPGHTELVLTGRNPDERFLRLADYVSEIQCRKHPYEKGIAARNGIEL